jgi:hypothetical protein
MVHASHAALLSKFIKITPCSRATKLVNFQIISTLSNESWNKILPSQAFTTHHPNVFTPILHLSEGRAGIAWVPSNKMLFFPPQIDIYAASEVKLNQTVIYIFKVLLKPVRSDVIKDGLKGSMSHVFVNFNKL